MPIAGQSVPHDSAREHVTGEAAYLDDLPPLRGELLVDFVGSRLAHARIRSVDVSAAKRMDGVVGVYTCADVPGENTFGPVFHDEELLAREVCHHIGQPVVALAATSRAALEAAKAAVRIDLEELPAVLTIDDAIARGQFIGPTRRIARGDAEAALAAAEHVLEGTFHSGGQEHFYLEPQAALAVPGEGGQLVIHSSTQNLTEIQAMAARCLGLRQNQVVCVCRRMGGGFGGKETQAARPALLAALVASRTRRPARIVLSCDQDMRVTGKRHPYQARYRVGFGADGRLTALRTDFYSNGGFSADLSLAVMERTLLHADNAYYIPHVAFTGTVCRTNLPSNTAFRGFGGPQAVAAVENVIEEVAAFLGLDAYEVRRRNCYGGRSGEPSRTPTHPVPLGSRDLHEVEGRNVTPYGQVVADDTLPALMERLAETSRYKQRLVEVRAFNADSRAWLKGISLVPVKFGISFTRRTLNQANALVNIYLDGTIQVSTGGTEMGQGLNTKVRQLVADQFALPAEAVIVMPTSTEKNNNTSPTAASASTDLNGTAAVRACEVLRGRLAEVAACRFASAEEGLEASPAHVCFEAGCVLDARRPGARLAFRELVGLAYEQRVSLGDRGFYATPGVDFNRETGKGNPFLYYTTGAAVAEVLIDRLTGDVRVTRADVLIDLGRSINPAIDRGQVVGGFVQGMGWVTTEALRYADSGELLSHSPTTYKVPNVTDVPPVFNVDFYQGNEERLNIHGSKAVGEPPLLLAVSVWAAVKHALSSVSEGRVPLRLPATNEEVLLRLEAIPARQPGQSVGVEPLRADDAASGLPEAVN
jgi:xanthine dehydrogenase large subunit